ncbi:MAG: FHA domain-containing protein, partial [Planctomycetaceae bacterium]|nr:FHA domain-containing protein [Planctomycetaceae bacterium]
FELNYDDDREIQAALHVLDPPEMPSRLSPGQAAQLAEVMEFVHARLRSLMNSATKIDTDTMGLSFRKWQSLLDLQSRVSEYIRRIGEPEE